ncbi:hypothetical protein TNCV_5032061 [Trichonephila clavipes]|nr:hypothetical protein TNCV_5032061 [Trichonephila clavipes]
MVANDAKIVAKVAKLVTNLVSKNDANLVLAKFSLNRHKTKRISLCLMTFAHPLQLWWVQFFGGVTVAWHLCRTTEARGLFGNP